MTVYTEEAATKEECLKKIYKRYDRNQVNIIRVHELTRGGFLGLFKKDVVEITYSFTPPLPSMRPKHASFQNAAGAGAAGAVGIDGRKFHESGYRLNVQSVPPSAAKSFDENRREIISKVMDANPGIKEKLSAVAEPSDTRMYANLPAVNRSPRTSGKPAVQLDLNLTDEGSSIPDTPVSGAPAAARPPEENVPRNVDMLMQAIHKIDNLDRKLNMDIRFGAPRSAEHENITKIEGLLEKNDFSASFINTILSKIRTEFTVNELSDFDFLQRTVVSWIGNAIQIAPEHSTMRPHIITLVGPTGIGKTTTVAKLAAAYIHAYKKAPRPLNVRVITIDNYRIGAKQHLEKFGEIIGVAVSSATTPSDLQNLVAGYQDADIILIDTAGRSPRDYVEIAKMRTFFDGLHNGCETLLAMSACTKASDLRDIVKQYETFACDGIIVTKFDETTYVGNIISVLAELKLPVAYITTGQRVPKDFEQASALKFLLALDGFSVDRLKLEEEFPVPANCFEWS